MQRRRPGPVRHEKAPFTGAAAGNLPPPPSVTLEASWGELEANAGYPLRLLFEHLCVVANALEGVVGDAWMGAGDETLATALDALDHIIDRVAESLPPEDQ